MIAELPAELVAGLDVRAVTPVRGGDIAHAFRLDTPDGPLFAKTHPAPPPALFEREAAGLRRAPGDRHRRRAGGAPRRAERPGAGVDRRRRRP